MLTVGVNVPKPLRFPIRQKADDEATREVVRKHPKFAAAVAALAAADSGPSSSAPAPPQPLQREQRALASNLPFRSLPRMPEPQPSAPRILERKPNGDRLVRNPDGTPRRDEEGALVYCRPSQLPRVPPPAAPSELPDPPQPGSHGKAHHTPVHSADEPPAKHAAVTLPGSMASLVSPPPPPLPSRPPPPEPVSAITTTRDTNIAITAESALSFLSSAASAAAAASAAPSPLSQRATPPPCTWPLAAQPASSTVTPVKLWDECRFCHAPGPAFCNGQRAYPSTSNEMVSCPTCSVCVCFCNTTCERRGVCPNHWDDGVTPSWEFLYRAYAEVAAGIGCKCHCCLQLLDEDWFTSDEDLLGDDGSWDRGVLKAALAATGNPACRLAEALAHAELQASECAS